MADAGERTACLYEGNRMIQQKKLQLEYCCLQGFYWMLYCVGVGYLNAYLTGVGLRPGTVGVISAVCGTLATVVQPFLGKLADRSQRYGWKMQLQVLLVLCMGCYHPQRRPGNSVASPETEPPNWAHCHWGT